jgi:hypothetical protein
MAAVSSLPGPRSIQREQQQVVEDTLWATEEEIRAWLEAAHPGWIICKERVRHGYTRAKRGERLHFQGKTNPTKTRPSYYVRRVVCPDCQACELVEWWVFTPKKGTKNMIGEARMIHSYPNYIDKNYLAVPGTGRMKTSTLREIIVMETMVGTDLREIEDEIAEYQSEHVQVYSAS